jgi:hypothetical protein
MRRAVQTLALVAIVGSIAAVAIFARGTGSAAVSAPQSAAPPQVGAPSPPMPVKEATGSDLIALAPAVPPKELPGECTNFSTVSEVAPRSIGTMARQAFVVALGSVTEIGPAQWNTPDGAPPTDRVDWNADSVMRLVRLKVDRLVAGTAPDMTTVWISGGTIGCRTFLSDRVPEVEVGSRFAIFADATPPKTGLKGALRAQDLWPISADNTVTDPELGRITLDDFVARASANIP